MRVWRICKAQHAGLDGEGARLYGGRWNPRGHAMVYTSCHASLAALELLVQVRWNQIGQDFMLLGLDVPDGYWRDLDRGQWPDDWRSSPAPPPLAQLGLAWLQRGDTLALRVPAAVMPHEFNLLLNPKHSAMQDVQVAVQERLVLDARLRER